MLFFNQNEKLNPHFCSMSIHIGEKIKQRAKHLRIGPTELGKLINTSKQNVYGIYKRRSIDVEMLKKISKALDHDFFQYFVNENLSVVNEPIAKYTTSSNKDKAFKEILQELEHCKKEVERLKKEVAEKEISYLKKINEMLEKSRK